MDQALDAERRRFQLAPPVRQSILVTALVWMSVAAPMLAVWLLRPDMHGPVDLATFAALVTSSALFGLLVLGGYRLAYGRAVWLGWTIVVLSGVAAWLLQYGSEFGIIAAVRAVRPDEMPPTPHSFAALVGNSLDFVVTNALVAALLGVLATLRRVREESARALEAQGQASEAELRALRLQLNPHFLLNSLNAVSSLVAAGRTAEAEATLERLSGFLRGALEYEPTGKVTLEEELDSVAAFLDVERVRFGDRLRLVFDCPEDLDDALVPELILQPLVENAVKYAVAPSRGPVALTVRARREGEGLLLQVSDSGGARADGAAGLGVGLRNTFQRLQALYGKSASLTTDRREDGFTVELRLPLERAASRGTAAPALAD